MKKISTAALISAILIFCVPAVHAQNSTSMGYFLDNYSFNYRFNPSIQSDRSFFSLGLGNITLSEGSSLGAASLLFPGPDGGPLVTGLNKSVSNELFASKLKDLNRFTLDENINIFSLGVRTRNNSMFNLEVNIKAYENLLVPKSMLMFLKAGGKDMSYDLSQYALDVNSVAEIAAGYSKKVNKLTIGARLKFHWGIAAANVYSNKLIVNSNSDYLQVDADANMRMAANALKIGVTEDGKVDFKQIEPNLMGLVKPAGIGGAIDLGVTYDFSDCLSATIGISDLGLMKWNYALNAHSEGGLKYNGIQDVDIIGGTDVGTAVQDELNSALESIQGLLDFKQVADAASKLELMPFTVNAGVKYAMPFYKKLSVRGTFMYHTDTKFHFLEGRVGLTILPVNWFCLTGNVGYNTYGATWGAGVTLNVAILNIHAGIESYMGQVTKPYAIAIKDQPLPVKLSLPLNGSRYLATIGLSVTIGHSQNAHATPKREKKVKASKVKTTGHTMEIVE